MGSSFYYLVLSVTSIAISVYNLSMGADGKNYHCYVPITMNQGNYTQYMERVSNNVTSNEFVYAPATETNTTSNGNVTYTVYTTTSNIFATIQTLIGALYMILCILSILLGCVINSMADMIPDDFQNIGWCKRGFAILCKVLPPLFVILHWVILIFIIIIWVLYATGNCAISVLYDPKLQKQRDFYISVTYTLNIVTTVFWGVIHYGGAIIRELVYQEPFMYSPDIGKPNKCRSIFFKRLGP